MSLAAGTRLGPYEILGPLGAGGMGEVYRARDTRLDRTVAVKVLPTQTIPSDEVRNRFEREAKAISQLSHPHICTLFDVGRAEDTDFLVMELLEGETLQARLARGPLPVEQVLRTGVEIASALEMAHRRGIIHRDLKPGNLMLTRAGIKLLDFGLARTIAPALGSAALSEVRTTTVPTAITAQGAILGTLQYMAPEQLEGKPADARTDIFALGGVLFEMTTGQRAFGGPTAAALASEILRGEVPALTSLRRDSPPALERLVSACLAKDPDERWQSAHDVKLQLAALSGAPPAAAAEAAAPASRRFLPWVVAAIASGVAAAMLLRRPAPPAETARQIRFALPPPEGGRFAGWTEATTYTLSPDGSTLAFIATDTKGRRIFLQPLSSLHAKALEGTEGALAAFWSPDGKSLGFFADEKLKRLDLGSGAAVPICNVRSGSGITGTWGADGQILFASIEGNAIFRVSTAGGEPVAERQRQPEAGIQRVVWPSFLPDGKRYLYLIRRPDRTYRIMFAEMGGTAREVRPSDSFAQYVAPGYLVFAREGALLAQRFDATTGRVEGEPVAIAEPVMSFTTVGWASFAVSAHGVLAYASPGNRARLHWFDRTGHDEALESTASMLWVRFSPDGRRALFNREDPRTGNLDIWSLDLARGVESRVTSDPDTETYGLLLPDGSLVYSEPRGASPQLFRRNLGTGETREVVPEGSFQIAQDVTPDARTLVFAERLGYGAWDLFQVALAGGPAQPLLATPFDEIDLRLSPDGRFAAFVSNEPGRGEVYVAPFPKLGERTRVTQEGASGPRWSRDGRELFYVTADRRLVAVPVRTGASIELGTPHTLFALPSKYRWASYDVAPDGRFLAIVPEALASEQPLTVVVNWMADLRTPPSH
jgi:eukaryotic-like serine/threonine-protein kinase